MSSPSLALHDAALLSAADQQPSGARDPATLPILVMEDAPLTLVLLRPPAAFPAGMPVRLAETSIYEIGGMAVVA